MAVEPTAGLAPLGGRGCAGSNETDGWLGAVVGGRTSSTLATARRDVDDEPFEAIRYTCARLSPRRKA